MRAAVRIIIISAWLAAAVALVAAADVVLIHIELEQADAVRVREAICEKHGWTADLGITKGAFTRRHIKRMIVKETLDWEAHKAVIAAQESAQQATLEMTETE